MSAPMTTPMAGPPAQDDGSRPIPFLRLVKVEFHKAVDTVASFWLMAAILILVILFEGGLLLIVLIESSTSTLADYAFIAQLISGWTIPVLAIMLVTTEWSQRTAMVTFAVEPRRLHVIGAKYVVCLVVSLASSIVALILGFVCAGIAELFLPDETMWGDQAGSILGLAVVNLLAMSLGFALGCLLLNTPAAIVSFFIYRVLPLAAFAILAGTLDWFADLQPWISFEYAQGPLYEWDLDRAEEWAHFLVSGALWLGLPLGIGMWRILRAEVK